MNPTKSQALFADLVYNEENELAAVVYIGDEPFYAIPDDDFLRHVEAEHVDRQIVARLQARLQSMGDVITDGVQEIMGPEALFAPTAIQHAIDHMDEILRPGVVDVDQFRTALWMAGFRATVDLHGDLVRIDFSASADASEP